MGRELVSPEQRRTAPLTPPPPVVDEQLRRAVRATYTVFAGSGFAFANWASRIPQVRQHFHLKPSSLGLVLLAIAAGSLLSMPMTGTVIARTSSRFAVTVTSVLLAVGLATVAGGYLVGLPMLVVGLFVFGFSNGAWDVAMNVHGAAVERRTGRSIMPRFHAGWSVGTVAGALVGAIAVAVHLPVTVHLDAIAVLVVIVVPRATRHFLAGVGAQRRARGRGRPRPPARATATVPWRRGWSPAPWPWALSCWPSPSPRARPTIGPASPP